MFLKAYREVFDYLIESFKTYKPMLASIKNEYEMMLADQQDEIQRLLPLQVVIVVVVVVVVVAVVVILTKIIS